MQNMSGTLFLTIVVLILSIIVSGGGISGSEVCLVVFCLPYIAGSWRVFAKASKPGWAALIPIYDAIVLLNIARKPLWWIVLFIIPVANIVAALLVNMAVAQNFGKSRVFGICLALLWFIFYPILGFSEARYQPAATAAEP